MHRAFDSIRAHRGALFGALLAALAIVPGLRAQEGPAQWLARIFDPTSLKLDVFPGAQLNRKLSVDAIQLERGGNKRIAIFIIPPDQVRAAAEQYAQQLGVRPHVISADTPFATYVFDFTGADAPARYKGLRIQISRSQFVDNKGQITMEHQPPTP